MAPMGLYLPQHDNKSPTVLCWCDMVVMVTPHPPPHQLLCWSYPLSTSSHTSFLFQLLKENNIINDSVYKISHLVHMFSAWHHC